MRVPIQIKRPRSTPTRPSRETQRPVATHTAHEDKNRDIPVQLENAARGGHSLARIPIFPSASDDVPTPEANQPHLLPPRSSDSSPILQ
jgi:hypothetical protein